MILIILGGQESLAESKKTRPVIMAVAGVMVNQLDDSQSALPIELAPKKNNVGFFLGGEYMLKRNFSVELNMIAANWQYASLVETQPKNELSTRFHFPLLFRWSLWRFFSIGLGGYASYRLGEIKDLRQVSSEIAVHGTSAENYGNHGLEGSVRLLLPLDKAKMALLMDFRYSYSLTPRPNEATGWQSFFLGLRRRI